MHLLDSVRQSVDGELRTQFVGQPKRGTLGVSFDKSSLRKGSRSRRRSLWHMVVSIHAPKHEQETDEYDRNSKNAKEYVPGGSHGPISAA